MIGILDYGSGNSRSVSNALDHLGFAWRKVSITSDVERCQGLILPGVGNYGFMAEALRQSGLWESLQAWVEADRPYLGICLGMQALFEGSDEAPQPGLGFFEGWASRFPEDVCQPHIGWNTVRLASREETCYFAHSYRVVCAESAVGWTEHGSAFVSWVRRGHVEGVQFHPEKSGSAGLRILADWCRNAQ